MEMRQFFKTENLDESLILCFRPDLVDLRILLVLCSASHDLRRPPWEAGGQPTRLFHRIVFTGIMEYSRTDPAKLYKELDRIDPAQDGKLVVIYGIKTRLVGDQYFFSARFAEFGNVEFICSGFAVETKILVGDRPVPDVDWYRYTDAETGDVANFYNPFDD